MYLWSLPVVALPEKIGESILIEGCLHLTALVGFSGDFFHQALEATKDDSK
jgi:hypothetical protein